MTTDNDGATTVSADPELQSRPELEDLHALMVEFTARAESLGAKKIRVDEWELLVNGEPIRIRLSYAYRDQWIVLTDPKLPGLKTTVRVDITPAGSTLPTLDELWEQVHQGIVSLRRV